MLYGGQSLVYIFELKGIYIFVLIYVLWQHLFFGVKIGGLSSLAALLLFESLLLHTSFPSLDPPSLTFPSNTVLCCYPMPPRRESLASVKARLVREQKIRTDRRVEELLHPRQRGSDIEVFDDREEEDRIASRRARGLGVQTQFPTFSFFLGVSLVFALFWFFL